MRVYICDDREEELKKYEEVIRRICDKNSIYLELVRYESGKKLLFDIEDDEQQPDVIYLDIHLVDENGVEVAEALRAKNFRNEIIFLTASEEYMLDGYDVEALHYVVKGKTKQEKFEWIFLRAVERAGNRRQEVISFSCAGETCTVPINKIKYFEVKRRVISVYYEDAYFEFYSSLEKIENLLFRKGFVRVHRSYLVSLTYIASQTYDELILQDGTRVPVGRAYIKKFREMWEQYQTRKSA